MSFEHHKDNVVAGLISPDDLRRIREAVCVQVEKIYDSCREKDCIEHARVYDIRNAHTGAPVNIENATNVKVRKAEVEDVYADIEPVPFKRGFYTIDVKYCITVTLDIFFGGCGCHDIVSAVGKVFFDKKVILFGSEGGVQIFKSFFIEDGQDHPRKEQSNLPIAKIEVAEPIALNAVIREKHHCHGDSRNEDMVAARFLGNNITAEAGVTIGHDHGHDHDEKRILVTLGLFSIIKLARFVQLLIPAFDFCVPAKECIAATEENPCDLFDTIDFPVDEFFPPQIFDFPGAELGEEEMEEHEHNKHHKDR